MKNNMMNSFSSQLQYRFRIASRLFSSQYALMLEYRAEIALWALSGVLPLIMLGLWLGSESFKAYLFSKEDIIRYFISVFIVRQFTAVWVMVSFEEDHLEGKLSPYLLQPLHPFWRYLFSHLAEQFSRLPIVLIMLIPLFICFGDSFKVPNLFGLVLVILSILMAFFLRFLLHWNFAILCFWNEKASALERLLLIPYIFLSGLVAPIETFPPYIAKLSYLTPFPFFISYPAKLLSGQSFDITSYIISVFTWAFLLFSISHFMWKKGVRKYSGMGA